MLKNLVRIAVQLLPAQYTELQGIAATTGNSVASLIREAVADWLAARGNPPLR